MNYKIIRIKCQIKSNDYLHQVPASDQKVPKIIKIKNRLSPYDKVTKPVCLFSLKKVTPDKNPLTMHISAMQNLDHAKINWHEKGTQQNNLRCPFLVRETGLEPVRYYHTPLKRARLPVPPLSHLVSKKYYIKAVR